MEDEISMGLSGLSTRTTGWYRIDTPNDGAPDVAALGALGYDPLAIGRASVVRLDAALARLAGGAP